MRTKILLLFALIVIGLSKPASAQTFTVNHQIPWGTTYQNMWGPNGSPFSLNFDYELFHFMYDSTLSFGEIVNILGGDFGAEFDMDAYLEMGSTFSIHGFTTGSVDVQYPVDIELTFPDAATFNPGQYMTINSDYDVLPGWDLSTHFPSAGVISLDLDFGLGLDLSGQVCFIGCVPINIMNVDVPYDSIVIFELNSITGEVTYPCIDGFLPGICHDTILPLVIDNIGGIGLTLTADIPYIETTDSLGSIDKCLYAHGDDYYMTLELDIIQFLSFMTGLIPPPQGPAIQALLANLNGSFDLGYGMNIEYSLLQAYLTMTNTLQQDFTFCPKIWTELAFPTSMSYFSTDPLLNDIVVDSGFNDTIVFQVGHDLHVQWPCTGYTDMDAGIKHWLTNDFTNHTWDSIAFDFILSAFEFTINFPSFPVVPANNIPELCIDYTPTGSALPSSICTHPADLNPIYANFSRQSIHIGPLIDFSIPIGWFPLTWYQNTWELAGFHDTIFPPVYLEAGPFLESEILGSHIICFGDSTGEIIAHAINGSSPFTFDWSLGVTNTNIPPYDSVLVTAGTYWVVITDGGGCTVTDSITLYDNPQIYVSLTGNNINCFGDSTGSIASVVSGGVPGYSYLWIPSSETTANIDSIPAGFYTLMATDTNGCTQTDTITLIDLHPHPTVDIIADPTIGCQPLLVIFNELNPAPGNLYLWDFGDNTNNSMLQSPTHIYDTSGTFGVSLTVTNEFNCSTTEFVPDFILVYPKPEASFTAYPMTVYSSDDPSWLITFTNTSNGSNSWLWNFGEVGSSSNSAVTEHASHNYGAEGVYVVTLIASNELGCSDTATVTVETIDDILIFTNIITPNNDGFNDVFTILNVEKFPLCNLKVFNRWGNIVYEASPYKNDWDGGDSSEGTYYYTFTYGVDGREFKGTITIIK